MRFLQQQFPARPSHGPNWLQSTRQSPCDGALGGVCRVGGAHHFAVLRNGVFTFQNLKHDRTRGHEGHQIVVERALGMNSVEGARLSLAQLLALLGNNAQAGSLKTGVDLACQICLLYTSPSPRDKRQSRMPSSA